MAHVREVKKARAGFGISRVLVPIDFSEHSKYALRYAAGLASSCKAEIVACYVVEPTIFPADFSMGQVGVPNVEDELRVRGKEELDNLVMKVLPTRLKRRTIVRTGPPAAEIVRLAAEEEVDMIVIAAHGHGKVEHFLFGSTTERVIRRAACPVLTVRHPAV